MPETRRGARQDHWAGRLREVLPGRDIAGWMERRVQLFKRDTHSRVGLIEIAGQYCFLKLYLAKSAVQALGFRLGHGRGFRSFRAAGELLGAGLAVPAPLACLRVPEGLVLLTEAVADGCDLRRLTLAGPSPEQFSTYMAAAGEALAALHRGGFAHGDSKWGNLVWDGVKFYLVDLEAVRKVAYRAGPQPQSPHLRDLARFTVDAEELGASSEHYDLFLNTYCAGTGSSRATLPGKIGLEAAPIRQRHARNHGTLYKPLCP